MNKSLATRFKKFLIENGASVHVDNQTSTYYKYCDKKIRVSDHLPAIFGCNIYVILTVDSNQFILNFRKETHKSSVCVRNCELLILLIINFFLKNV